jgi:GNAT superfamily N-acetyltransferase
MSKIGLSEQTSNRGELSERQRVLDLLGPEDFKFVFPHPATGEHVSHIPVREGNGKEFTIPVSLTVVEKRFHLDGVRSGSENGAIVSGYIDLESAVVNHIEVDESFRGLGVGKELISDLEERLRERGVKKILAVFGKKNTLEYLLRCGYDVVDSNSISDEEKKRLGILDGYDFDVRITDKKSFDSVVENEEDKEYMEVGKVLLEKKLV